MQFFENNSFYVTCLVWNKNNPIPTGYNIYVNDIEFIVYVREKGATFNVECDLSIKYKCKKYPITHYSKKLHPTQKPINLIEQFILLHSNENDIVLDPFAGSGTTGVACVNLNRSFIGIEKDKDYFEIAQARIENAQNELKQQGLFDE